MNDQVEKQTVLVVDDTPANIKVLMETLKDDYRIVAAVNGERALQLATSDPNPDIILLDVMMPEMDGYEVCAKLKADGKTRDIPIIFVTAMSDTQDETKGLELGAVDYITKPISPPVVSARVKNHLELRQAREILKNQNLILEQRVEERTREVLELQKSEFELRVAKEKVENELNIAAQIQKGILPSSFPAYPDRKEFELHAFMKPARYIGGDFYDFFFIDDNTLALVMADVSDKGVPAALFMMVSRTLIRSLAFDNRSPSAVLEKANNIMCQNNDSGMFVTVFLAFYDVSSGKLTATNGGHSASLVIDRDGTSREWATTHGPALGFMEELPYKEETMDLKVGQTLFLYTDGVTEAVSPGNELFGLDRLQELLKRKHDFKLDRLCSDIEISLSEFQEDLQFDDITMLALKRII
ncbi:MAG: SpoIIE family protein phosphatase [Desulfobacterales bacterium]|jgi:sigma-B regulation protein RsbU (phosphoserine phosphatase)